MKMPAKAKEASWHRQSAVNQASRQRVPAVLATCNVSPSTRQTYFQYHLPLYPSRKRAWADRSAPAAHIGWWRSTTGSMQRTPARQANSAIHKGALRNRYLMLLDHSTHIARAVCRGTYNPIGQVIAGASSLLLLVSNVFIASGPAPPPRAPALPG